MIELNLLPKELRKQKQKTLPDLPVFFISICVLVTVIAVHILLVVVWAGGKHRCSVLEKEWNDIQPNRMVVDKIGEQIKEIEKKIAATKELSSSGIDWVEILDGLNQAMIPNVWLSGFTPVLSGAKDKKSAKKTGMVTLELTGYAVGKSEATSVVGKFIDSLKKKEGFIKYFDEDIDLQDMHNQLFETEEVMTFKLICKVKSAAVDEPGKNNGKR
ncbi:MAG TPA: hypothetical protein PKY78_07125 [Candidatus Omnitrophota bacterium]|nr:hypothetical protein [Candidatus Omnitrophota bacterium]HPS20738.1 hypothetical protein [Candidatus Omnitrophota bacterium]